MVGKRAWDFREGKRNALANGYEYSNGYGDDGDAEAVHRPKPRTFRFQDIGHIVIEDNRRKQLKDALLEGGDRERLEKYRKSKEDVSALSSFFSCPFRPSKSFNLFNSCFFEMSRRRSSWRYFLLTRCAAVESNQEQESAQVLRTPERALEFVARGRYGGTSFSGRHHRELRS